jgi:hypothetical protein
LTPSTPTVPFRADAYFAEPLPAHTSLASSTQYDARSHDLLPFVTMNLQYK